MTDSPNKKISDFCKENNFTDDAWDMLNSCFKAISQAVVEDVLDGDEKIMRSMAIHLEGQDCMDGKFVLMELRTGGKNIEISIRQDKLLTDANP